MKYAAGLEAHGHEDWQLPSASELDELYQNRTKSALSGTFDTSGRLYWSSSEASSSDAGIQRFSDGSQFNLFKHCEVLVRCVRR